MSKILITSESTCDLSPELIEQFGFQIIPLYVTLGEQSLRDGVDAAPEILYKYVDEKKELPKTSAATITDYVDFFAEWTAKGYEVLHISISHFFSSAYQNAKVAAEEVSGVIRVVDGGNLSTGTALLMLDAYDLAQEGKTVDEIAEEITRRVPLVRASFVVDLLDYLRMGGRCSSVAALGANLLKLHPRIYVADGKMGVGEKYRGGIDDVMEKYVRQMVEQNEGKLVGNRCFITHTKCRPETVKRLVDETVKTGAFGNVYDTTAGCVITSHCGPGTLGILFEVSE